LQKKNKLRQPLQIKLEQNIMNPCIFAFTIISYALFAGNPDSGKNKYIPYNNENNGGGPNGYYNKFPKFKYINCYSPNVVYGKVVPVKMKPKNKPKNKDSI